MRTVQRSRGGLTLPGDIIGLVRLGQRPPILASGDEMVFDIHPCNLALTAKTTCEQNLESLCLSGTSRQLQSNALYFHLMLSGLHNYAACDLVNRSDGISS